MEKDRNFLITMIEGALIGLTTFLLYPFADPYLGFFTIEAYGINLVTIFILGFIIGVIIYLVEGLFKKEEETPADINYS